MFIKTTSRSVRGIYAAAASLGSSTRKLTLRLRYPGIVFAGKVHISRDCDIQAQTGARLLITDCYVGRGVTLIAGPDSLLAIGADYIGPNSTVVARESVTIGSGSKLAEIVTVRDGNHDHTVPLRAMRFTSAAIVIAEDVWLGAGSTVVAGVSIAKGATVAAGAVVTRNVAPGQTVGGVPARPLRRRN